MNGLLLVAAVVVVLGGAWAAFLVFGGWKLVGSSFEDEASISAPVTEIQVAPPGLAKVDIRTSGASQVRIHRTVRYLSPLVGRPEATHRIEGKTLFLDQCGFGCAIDYVVDAPSNVHVSR